MVELESTGLRSRNTYRFHIINPTSDNYEFLWESVGEPSPFWRCVQSAGMLFAGKRIEMVFEYLPDEVAVAEAFFKFKLANAGLEQLFVFAGKVVEPKVSFSSNKVRNGGSVSLCVINVVIFLCRFFYIPFLVHTLFLTSSPSPNT